MDVLAIIACPFSGRNSPHADGACTATSEGLASDGPEASAPDAREIASSPDEEAPDNNAAASRRV